MSIRTVETKIIITNYLDPDETETESHHALPSCLLCDSQHSCYQLAHNIRDKWSYNLCYLYNDIDLIDIKSIIENACYCYDCHQQLREINETYEAIKKLNAKLQGVKSNYESKLRSLLEHETAAIVITDHNNKSCHHYHNNDKVDDTLKDHGPEANTYEVEFGSEATGVYEAESDELNHVVVSQRKEIELKEAQENRISNSGTENAINNVLHSSTLADFKTHFPTNSIIEEGTNITNICHPTHVLIGLTNQQEGVSDNPVTFPNETEVQPDLHLLVLNDDNLKKKYNIPDCFVKVKRLRESKVNNNNARFITNAAISPSPMVPFLCPQDNCGQTFQLKVLKDAHFRRKHEGNLNPYVCSTCNRSFRSYVLLNQHLNVHNGLKPFQCQNCHKKFFTKDLLYKHQRMVHQPSAKGSSRNQKQSARLILCAQCGKNYWSNQDHNSLCSVNRSLTCELCGKTFKRFRYLKAHRTTHSELQLEQLKCQFCDKVLTNRRTLRAHVNKHTGNLKFRCDSCNYGSSSYSDMKNHKAKVHNDAKDHACDLCSNRYKSEYQLKKHKNSKHLGINNNISCHICGKVTCDKYTLTRHLQRMHSEFKAFQCSFCGETFAAQEYLNKHLRKRHNEGDDERQRTAATD